MSDQARSSCNAEMLAQMCVIMKLLASGGSTHHSGKGRPERRWGHIAGSSTVLSLACSSAGCCEEDKGVLH